MLMPDRGEVALLAANARAVDMRGSFWCDDVALAITNRGGAWRA
jgi:hypothetical protein